MKKLISVLLVFCMLLQLCIVATAATKQKTAEQNDYCYIVLTPDSFTEKGAWKRYGDADFNGLTFLLGGMDGTPSPDNPATTTVVLPKMGSYTVYTLSKDYATDPGTRFYQVGLGSEKQTTGNHGLAGWNWQKSAPIFSLGGETEVSLTDTSGTYPRCAMVVITDDPNFAPENDIDSIEALAEQVYQPGSYTFSDTVYTEGRPNSEIAVQLNGKWMEFDVNPVLLNDRTMVPFRAIFEALGCTVSWDDATQTAIGTRNGLKISLPIGSKTVNVGGQGTVLDQPAALIQDRTMVPLRFVSEALGAKVEWLEDTQTVIILADVPSESVLFVMDSFVDAGTWTSAASQSDGAFNGQAFFGTTPDNGRVGATIDDADASGNKPAIANFSVQGGTYRIWVRSRDFAENQQGTRCLNVGFDGEMLPHKYGTHGGNGYAWASGGTVTLTEGNHTLYVYDTSGFYARFDAVYLCKDLDYVPAESYETMLKIATPISAKLSIDYTFPSYAKEQNTPTESVSIENADTKVVFYKVPTSNGQVVQNEIYSKYNGQWVLTNSRSEELGYLVMRADQANSSISKDSFALNTVYDYQGTTYGGLTSNPFEAGVGIFLIPTDFTTDGQTVTLYFQNDDIGTATAVWSLDNNNQPKVSFDITFNNAGYYSVAAWEGDSFASADVEYALAPFRVQYKRIPESPSLLAESYLFTPMGTYTLPANNAYSEAPVTKGIVVEPEWIPLRWVYADNCKFGISMKSSDNLCRGMLFAPAIGTADSKMEAGQQYNLQYRVVSTVADWFTNYESVACDLFGLRDYRENYNNSLNDVIYNTRNLMLDDAATGWDSYSKGFYNMEGKNVATNGNPMQMLQEYLLTDSEDILTRRAIPTLANTLTRKNGHFNRVGDRGGAGWSVSSGDPDTIGAPVSNFNANVVSGLYSMSRGSIPYLHSYSIEKGAETASGATAFENDLGLYKSTGDKKYLDSAIQKADAYLKEVVYAESTETPAWEGFIYTGYFPSLSGLIDMYEATKDQKYLDAAENIAQWMSTALWVPGIDGDKAQQAVTVNGQAYIDHNNYGGLEVTNYKDFWWYGSEQYRVGRNASEIESSTAKVLAAEKQAESWISSRVGLGVEQASTFTRSSNIIMQCFAGDFMKLTAYTGNDYYGMIARNAIIGRFKSYDGYYRSTYSTYEFEVDYPREGPDFTGMYWHHIPPYLAMLEDFLINQAFAWSAQSISFPSLRQMGYAYFDSNQYGYEAGKFFDQNSMWLWLDEGIVSSDNIQIDYIAARKDGVLGIAFMNESDKQSETVFTLGEKVGSYTGTADLYDKTGKIGTVAVQDGQFTLTVPAKGLLAVVLNTDTVHAPSYAALSNTSKTIGATVSEHTNGKGYTLQMTPNNYYAYVYITDLPSEVSSLQITYDTGAGATTETTAAYPYEFIIPVEDANAEFSYQLTAVLANGKTESYGKGVLMTAARSNEKGYKDPEKSDSAGGEGGSYSGTTAAAKKLSFKAFKLQYTTQGTGATGLRFVVPLNSLPFTPDATNVVGLPVSGKVIDKSKNAEIPFSTYIVGYEARDNTNCTLIVQSTIDIAEYVSTYDNPNYSWDATVSPISK